VPHLLQVARKPAARLDDDAPAVDAFPFSVPTIRTLVALDVGHPVTFFVGENGTGKSTLLEAIAIAAELPTVGSEDAARDPTLAPQRALASTLRLSWARRTRRGFFLRAEDFFGSLKARARNEARIERERREVAGVADDELLRRGEDLVHPDERDAARFLPVHDARSHGESFLDLFTGRMHGAGLYLLDEPESPLSPQRQIALLGLVLDAARAGAQFIVATHSPILLAYPGARIVSFDAAPPVAVPYAELEHVRVTRDFLDDPERYLRHLAAESP
jgi:predicted ATPase